MSKATLSGVEIIEAIPRDVFRQKFVRELCRTQAFAALYSFRAKHTSPEEKFEVRTFLADNGVPLEITESDKDLDEIAAVISARAVSLM